MRRHLAASASAAVAAHRCAHSAVARRTLTTQQRIALTQPLCNAYITPGAEAVAADAAASASADPAFTVSIKDSYCTTDLGTTAGSAMLAGFRPTFDATAVARLRTQGATITGKTNMDEFGMGSFSANSHFERVINPWSYRKCTKPEHFAAVRADEAQLLSAGGSSGGSAAALASDTCIGSIGSDTGGSIRLPASYCGVLGLKPTYGRVSRFGLISYASSMDTVSIMTKSTHHMRRILNTIEGHDEKDATSIAGLPPTAGPSFNASSVFASASGSKRVLEGLTIGIPSEYDLAELSSEVRSAWHRMAELLANEGGARVVSCSLPNTRHALPAYYILAPAEAMSNLARYDGVRYGHSATKADDPAASGPEVQSLQTYYTRNRGAFGAEVQRRILVGSFVLSSRAYSSHFVRAQQIRAAVTADFTRLFSPEHAGAEKVDLLLTPTCVGTALSFAAIESERKDNPVASYLNDIFTIPSNLAGIPALGVPVGLSATSGLPIGLQLLGNYHGEARLLDVAAWMQERVKQDRVSFDLDLFKDDRLQQLAKAQ